MTHTRAFVFLALLFICIPAEATLTVSGTVTRENRDYTRSSWAGTSTRAVRFATVSILNSSDQTLAITSTSSSGFFSVSVSGLSAGDAFKVRVWAQTAAAEVGPSTTTIWNCTRSYSAGTSPPVSFFISRGGGCPTTNRALNIMDAAIEGYQYGANQAAGPPLMVDVVYPSTACVACYFQFETAIHISDGNEEFDDVSLHEYGHFLMDIFTTFLALPGGQHFFCQLASSSELAFSEGWASYVAAAIRNRDWWGLEPGIYFDLESGTSEGCPGCPCFLESTDYEGATGAVLWDTKDGSNEIFDAISNQENVTWDIIDLTWGSRVSFPDVIDFRNEWTPVSSIDPIMCEYTGEFCSLGPDLIVDDPGVSKSTLNPGESFTLGATTRNVGDATSLGSTLRYLLSSNPTITTSDIELSTDGISQLAPGGSDPDSDTETAPGSPGDYWVGACADAVSGEADTTNNCSTGVPITVTGAPDLVVTDVGVSKANLAPGEAFVLSAITRNQGNATSSNSTLRYLLSIDSNITTADTLLSTDGISQLAPGGLDADSDTETAPATGGGYWVGACADPVSGELATTNNCSGAVAIVVRSCSALETQVLTNLTISTSEVYEACVSIDAGPNFTVLGPSGEVTLRAGSRVILHDGFSVENGGSLRVYIESPP